MCATERVSDMTFDLGFSTWSGLDHAGNPRFKSTAQGLIKDGVCERWLVRERCAMGCTHVMFAYLAELTPALVPILDLVGFVSPCFGSLAHLPVPLAFLTCICTVAVQYF